MASFGFSYKEWERKMVSANNANICEFIRDQYKRCVELDSNAKFHKQFLFQYCGQLRSPDSMRHSEK